MKLYHTYPLPHGLDPWHKGQYIRSDSAGSVGSPSRSKAVVSKSKSSHKSAQTISSQVQLKSELLDFESTPLNCQNMLSKIAV